MPENKVDKKRLNLLVKIIESGRTDEKAISSITTREMIDICKDKNEIADLLDLQEAVKNNKLIPYLVEKK